MNNPDSKGISAGIPNHPKDIPIKVFVHLAKNKDSEEWKRDWASGKLVGLNDPTPYGYGRAEAMGCDITYSKSYKENLATKTVRFALRFITGFDLLHAWHQRYDFFSANVIWTHTESQFLGVAAILLRKSSPKIIGQSVWLIDRWPQLNPLHKWLYTRLINRVDVLTFHSPENTRTAQEIFPHKECRFVPFGIPSEEMVAPTERNHDRLNVLALGNDRHRDWSTLIKAVAPIPNATTSILSSSVPMRLARGKPSIFIGKAKTNSELLEFFKRATVVCVPLKPNLHASGITVVQEAVLSGVPVVATKAGGLEAYFKDDEIRYVEPGNPFAMRTAVVDIMRNPAEAAAMARRAQERMREIEMGAESYIQQHVDISRDLLRGTISNFI